MRQYSPQTCSHSFKQYLLQGFAWVEIFVCLGIHFYWVLGKGWPLAAESAWGAAVLVCAPFIIAAAVASFMHVQSFKNAMLRIEWMLHLSASLCFFVLLLYLTFRDPFNLWVPYSSPLCLWAIGLGCVLLANLTSHARCAGEMKPLKSWHGVMLGGVLWCVMLLVLAGMTWPAHCWTTLIVIHVFMALSTARLQSTGRVCPLLSSEFSVRVAASLESFALFIMILLALLQFALTHNQTGTLELRYVEFLDLFTSPYFFLGAACAFSFVRLRIIGLSHFAIAALIVFGNDFASWHIYLTMGYALVALFIASNQLGTLAYVILTAFACITWIIGLLAFNLVGVFEVELGSDSITGLTTLASRSLFTLLVLCLPVLWFNFRASAPRAPSQPAAESTLSPLWHPRLLYVAILVFLLLPTGMVLVSGGWYGTPIVRAPRIPIDEPFGICHAGYSKTDEEYAVLNELGVRIMRVDFHWSRIQPATDTWDFAKWDSYLDAAERNNMKVLALLDFDNNKVESSTLGNTLEMYIAPEDIPLYLTYVRRTIERYKGRVHAWEIWNEPDMPRFWLGTEEEFYELARRTATTVREADPTARLLGTAMTGPVGVWTPPMVAGMHTSGALDQVDHPTSHLYISDPRAYYNEYSKILAIAKKNSHPGAPWITETGDPDGGAYFWRASSDLLAAHVIKSHTIATSLGIDTLVWYCFRDSTGESQRNNPNNSEGFFGLVERDGQWKPAAYAYQLFTRHCSHSEIRSDLVRIGKGLGASQLRSTLFRRDNGESTLVLWNEPMLRPHAQARVHIDYGDLEGVPMVHDIGSTYTKQLLDEVIDVSEKPVFITFTTKDPDSTLKLVVRSSPVDGLWLLFLAALLIWAFIQSRIATDTTSVSL